MFDPHGRFGLVKDGNIIIVTVKDSFNESGAITWTKALIEMIQTFNDTPFFLLMNNENYGGFTLDAFNISTEFNDWLSHQAMIAKAIVCSNSAFIDLNKKNIPTLVKQKIRYFDNIDDALDFLKSQPEFKSGD